MPVSQEYVDYVLDHLGALGSILAKRMFGGVGLYLEGTFFALIADDTLYFKVDDSNRKDYEDRGMGPYRASFKKPMVLQYYEVPVEVLENEEELRTWAHKALRVALSKKKA